MRKSVTFIATAAMAVGLVQAGGTATSATTTSTDDNMRQPRTTIVLKINNCKGCKVRPVQWKDPGPTWFGKKKLVRKNKVVFQLRSKRTRGLTFRLRDPRADINAVPLIVTRYRGLPVGSKVSDAEARRGKKASPCWAGSRRDRVVRRVAVRRFTVGADVRVTRAWFRRTAPSKRPYLKTLRGALAVQDVIFCK